MRADDRRADRLDWRRVAVRLLALVIIALPWHASWARAEASVRALMESAGYERLEEAARDLDVGWMAQAVKHALAGELLLDANTLRCALHKIAGSVRESLLKALKLIAAPALATALLSMLLGRRSEALSLVCRLACASALAAPCAGAMKAAGDMLTWSARVTDVIAPVLSAAMALTGEGAASALLTPASVLVTDIAQILLSGPGIGLCAVAAAVNIAGSLSEHCRMDRLFALIRRLAVWGTGALTALITALLTVEGRLASAQDVASVRAMRWTIRSAIPFAGSGLADSAGALLQSAAVAKNALGIAGMALAMSACAGPLLRLLVYMLSLRLAAASVEPVADRGVVRITNGYADVAAMLLAVCAAGATMNVLLCGVCLGILGGQ